MDQSHDDDNNASQWRRVNSTLAIPKLRNRWSLKLSWVTKSGPLSLCKISLRSHQVIFAPRRSRRLESDVGYFLGSSSFTEPTPSTHFYDLYVKMTSFRARICLLGVPKTKFYISANSPPPKIKGNLWATFDGFSKIRVKRPLRMAMFTCLPLTVIVAQ